VALRRILFVLAVGLLAVIPTVGSASAAAPAGSAAATLAAGPAGPAPATAWDSATGARLAQWSCNTGNVCFWTGPDGTGSRCTWSGADPDWATGSIVCSWALTQNVKSVWNRGTSSSFTGVRYYLQTNYTSPIGCTRQGQSGNLAGTYKLRSHKWISTSCG
jgi:hypothetical protein